MRQNDDGKTVAAADCLVPGIGELIGGSQREERLELLEGRIRELGMDPKDYWWYCDLRRYGSCRHAGYGMGFERMVMYLTGINNIRDVEPVSYTHLDVYKRQTLWSLGMGPICPRGSGSCWPSPGRRWRTRR